MPKCRLCGQNRKLIEAHVIPEAFFREARGDAKKPRLISELQVLQQQKRSDGVSNSLKQRGMETRSMEISEHISKILELSNRSKNKVHTYLKFYGD